MGVALQDQGKLLEAVDSFNGAIEINPDYKYAKDALQNLKTNNQKYN